MEILSLLWVFVECLQVLNELFLDIVKNIFVPVFFVENFVHNG